MLFLCQFCHLYTIILSFWLQLVSLELVFVCFAKYSVYYHKLNPKLSISLLNFFFFLKMFKQVRNSFMFTFLKKSFLDPCNLHQWEGWSWTKCILATQAVPSLSSRNSLCLCPESTVFSYLDSSLHFGEAHLEKLLRVGCKDDTHFWEITYMTKIQLVFCFYISQFLVFCYFLYPLSLIHLVKKKSLQLVGPRLMGVFQ